MKPETIGKIRNLIENDVKDREDRVMHLIRNGFDQGLGARIAEYREALKAQEDFEEWADEQED